MMATKKNALVLTTPSDREIASTRLFDAPRRLVFEAHVRPEHLARWWGPRELTLTTCSIDLRVGGAWRFVQRAPDGSEFAFRGEFREIRAPERLVMTFEFEGMPGHVSVQTLDFIDQDGKTLLQSTMLFDSMADRDGMLHSGMERGAAESMDRLEELLQALGRDQ